MEPAGLHPPDRPDGTRRAQTGDAISLVCIDETDLLRGVQRLLRKAIPWTVEEGFIPDRNTPPQPLRGGPDTGRGRSSAGRGAPRARHLLHRKPVAALGGGRPRLIVRRAAMTPRVRRPARSVRPARSRPAAQPASVAVGCAAVAAACAACAAAAPVSTISAPGKKNPSIMSAVTRSTV